MTEESNDTKRKGTQSDSPASVDNEALLVHYGFGDLPVGFPMRGDDGRMTQQILPCYQCLSAGFYGRGRTGSTYQEDDTMIAALDFIPNDQLHPLNRAAALRYIAWRQSLPTDRAPIEMEDLSEASQMLAKDPRVKDLAPLDYQKALRDLAVRLKVKRLGKDALELMPIAHNFTPQNGNKAPPILGAKLSDMGARGPGFGHAGVAGDTMAGGVRRGSSQPAALGGATPPR